jgi:hypothetical protein
VTVGSRALGLFVANAVALSTASAQLVQGTVRAAGVGQPIANAEVVVYGSTGAAIRASSSDNGSFALRVPRPGSYYMDVRRLGYVRILGRALLVRGDTSLVVTMDAVVQRLDTVHTTETGIQSRLTPGREIVRRHLLLGRGLIVSGLEIERSGLLLSEYLGKLDGLKLVGVPPPQTPAIPGRGGFIVGTSRPNPTCLYARVNHSSLLWMLMQRTRATIDDLLLLREVMAVEIYRSRDEIPREWRSEMIVQDLFYRDNGGTPYVIGHSGALVDGGTLQHDSLSFLTLRLYTTRDTTLLRRPAGMSGARTRGGGGLRPPRMHNIPDCAFVQIWTRLAWD